MSIHKLIGSLSLVVCMVFSAPVLASTHTYMEIDWDLLEEARTLQTCETTTSQGKQAVFKGVLKALGLDFDGSAVTADDFGVAIKGLQIDCTSSESSIYLSVLNNLRDLGSLQLDEMPEGIWAQSDKQKYLKELMNFKEQEKILWQKFARKGCGRALRDLIGQYNHEAAKAPGYPSGLIGSVPSPLYRQNFEPVYSYNGKWIFGTLKLGHELKDDWGTDERRKAVAAYNSVSSKRKGYKDFIPNYDIISKIFSERVDDTVERMNERANLLSQLNPTPMQEWAAHAFLNFYPKKSFEIGGGPAGRTDFINDYLKDRDAVLTRQYCLETYVRKALDWSSYKSWDNKGREKNPRLSREPFFNMILRTVAIIKLLEILPDEFPNL